jgi:uncharacterized membrane protein YkoI
MTTQDTTDTPVEITDEMLENPDVGPAQLRAALKRERTENAGLRAKEMAGVYKEIHLDPNNGLGKAIAKEFDGDMTAEALAAYAKEEYGYDVPEAPTNPQTETITTEQGRLDAASQGAGSVPIAPTQAGAIAEAEAAGDWVTAQNLKAQQMEGWFKKTP